MARGQRSSATAAGTIGTLQAAQALRQLESEHPVGAFLAGFTPAGALSTMAALRDPSASRLEKGLALLGPVATVAKALRAPLRRIIARDEAVDRITEVFDVPEDAIQIRDIEGAPFRELEILDPTIVKDELADISQPLSDVIIDDEAAELFDIAYPGVMEDLTVALRGERGVLGEYFPTTSFDPGGQINLNPSLLRQPRQLQRTFGHELQHYAQDKTAFLDPSAQGRGDFPVDIDYLANPGEIEARISPLRQEILSPSARQAYPHTEHMADALRQYADPMQYEAWSLARMAPRNMGYQQTDLFDIQRMAEELRRRRVPQGQRILDTLRGAGIDLDPDYSKYLSPSDLDYLRGRQ